MITFLIALGAGAGGFLIGLGYSIWRIARRFTLKTRPVEPVQLPKGGQPGDVIFTVETSNGIQAVRTGMRVPTEDLAAAGLHDGSADYQPRHESDPLAWFRPIQEVMARHNLHGKPLAVGYHMERYPARHSSGLDSFDVPPPIPFRHPVSAEHPPTDIDD